ncbi:Hypothetical protein D9617_34g040980 [Elsinoe fawcettii]|nr:Hypothetical protein D9617_34g040980 [Elsinoe fawcettii]
MSSRNYDPDPDAVPSGSLATAILSQRDLSARIPINFVTHPSVSLASACFSGNRYEDNAIKKCLSNLLSTGFRRILLDVYWDPLLIQWSLCPAAVPSQLADPASSSSEATRSAVQTTGLSISDLPTTGIIPRHRPTDRPDDALLNLERRQTPTAIATPSATDSPSAPSSTTIRASDVPAPTEVAGSPGLFQLGRYQCTSTANINLIRDVFEDHFVNTGNNLNATLKYLILNIRPAQVLAGEDFDPDSVAPSDLYPISRTLNTTLAPFIYTPVNLQDQRSNLNASWFAAPFDQQPDTLYYHYTINQANVATTEDGWPSEGYAELIQAKRILVGFGTSSIPVEQYNTTLDNAIIFPPDILTTPQNVAASSAGAVTSGCLYTNTSFSPFQSNISFAIPAASSLSTFSTDPNQIYNISSSLSACGISPLLNTTLNTPATSIAPYTTFIRSALWSWQPDQPSSNTNDTQTRCATLNLTAPQSRWQVSPCTSRLQGACRIANQPYEWTLSTQRGPYDSIPRVCPPNSTFSVPRTALENSHLRAAVARLRGASDAPSLEAIDLSLSGFGDDQRLAKRQDQDTLVWLNLNDLDVQGCFVQGINSTCPYAPRAGEASRRVIVPVVAAVIVFVLAGLTVFVKCAANRAGVKRRRKRGLGKGRDGLGEYEGVPS